MNHKYTDAVVILVYKHLRLDTWTRTLPDAVVILRDSSWGVPTASDELYSCLEQTSLMEPDVMGMGSDVDIG